MVSWPTGLFAGGSLNVAVRIESVFDFSEFGPVFAVDLESRQPELWVSEILFKVAKKL